VKQIQFFAGTTAIGTATAAPFTINWDTTQTPNGAVAITAQAQDAAGNVTSSSAVNVTVNNAAAPPAVAMSVLQASVFTPICSTCHNGSGASLPGSMNLSTQAAAFAALVGVASQEVPTLKRVNPGDPTTSYIINKLEGTQTVGSRMPLGGPFLDQATIDQVKSWIASGAPNN
jgi:mono/diheme cytochrome c family protein